MVRGKGGAHTQHAADFLRVAESLQASFGKRVDADDLATAARGFLQRDQHARMVGARILTDHHNTVGGLKVFERDSAFAGPDRSHHANAARLVTHVGTVGEVVGAEHAHEQLIEECSFVTGAAGRIEERFVWGFQRFQFIGNHREGVCP